LKLHTDTKARQRGFKCNQRLLMEPRLTIKRKWSRDDRSAYALPCSIGQIQVIHMDGQAKVDIGYFQGTGQDLAKKQAVESWACQERVQWMYTVMCR